MLDGTGETLTEPNWYSWGIGYGYDRNANLSINTYPDNLTVDYLPNALGQATKVGNNQGVAFATGATYFPNGALKGFTYGNNIAHSLLQSARGLPQRSRDAYSTSPAVLDDSYEYDQNGNVAAILDGRAGAASDRTMGYDDLDRLTGVVSPMYGASGAHYTFDVLDNLVSVVAPGRNQRYCYDVNNRLEFLRNGSNCATGTPAAHYYAYDAQGNLATKDSQQYVFDFGNRLRRVVGKETYRYDGLGRRVLAYDAASTANILSQYGHDGKLMFQENARTGKNIDYLYLAGSLVAQRETPRAGGGVATYKYLHTDALGSPVAVTSASRQILESTQYEPFGQLVNRPLTDGPGYAGHVSDAITGLSYMQQRYYDPAIGRFLSVDPVTADGNTGGNFNRYKYAANNPYRFTDPDGRYECDKSLCGAVRSGLKEVRSAMNSTANREVRSALRGVLKFYGKEGVANGVSVKDAGGIGMANTVTQNGKTTISIGMEKLNSAADKRGISRDTLMGATLSHEGQHGIDQRADGMPTTRAQEKAGEVNAATTEARAWEGMKTDSWWNTWTNASGTNEQQIQKEAEASTKLWCGDGCK